MSATTNFHDAVNNARPKTAAKEIEGMLGEFRDVINKIKKTGVIPFPSSKWRFLSVPIAAAEIEKMDSFKAIAALCEENDLQLAIRATLPGRGSDGTPGIYIHFAKGETYAKSYVRDEVNNDFGPLFQSRPAPGTDKKPQEKKQNKVLSLIKSIIQ